MNTVSCSGLSTFQSEQDTSVVLMGNENSMALLPEYTLADSVAILIRTRPEPFPHFAFAWSGNVYDSKSSAKITAGSLAMFLSPGYAAAIPISAGAVVGVALEVRNVITAENDTNLVRRITAKLTNAFVQLKARHSTSQQTLMWRFYFLPGESASGFADYSFMDLEKYDTSAQALLPPTSGQAE